MRANPATSVKACLLLLCLLASGTAGAAQSTDVSAYPNKPVRLVVPFAAGGLNDTLARVFGEALGTSLGVAVVIDNRAGASGTIGMGIGAKANPDGYTLVFSSSSAIAVAPNLYKVPYDPVNDFRPISTISALGSVLLVHPEMKARSVAELIALAKASPGHLKFGSVGPGTSQHLAGELFKGLTGIEMLHVPYKGGGQVLTDMLARQIDIDFEPIPTALAYIKSGRLRPLGVTTTTRSRLLPDVPSMDEAGVRGYDSTLWNGLLAPAGTPERIVARLHTELLKIVNSPEMVKRLAGLGAEPITRSPEQFKAYISSEIARWGKLAKALNLKAD